MSQFLKPVDNTAVDPSYAKIWRAYEQILPDVTGNNATFGGSGTFKGQLSISNLAAEILSKNNVYKYSANGVNAQNDFFGFTYVPPMGLLAGTRSVKFLLKTSNINANELALKIKFVGGASNGLISSNYIKLASTQSVVECYVDIPSDITSLVIGFQHFSTNTSASFLVDNISLNYNAFQTVNLSLQEAISYTGYTSKDGVDFIKFKTRDSIRSSFGNIINVDDTTYANHTRFNVIKPCNVTVTAAGYYASGAAYIGISHYNSTNTIIRQYQTQSSGSTVGTTTTQTIKADAGDYFVAISSAALVDSNYANFSIIASAISENVVQSWQDGMADWADVSSLVSFSNTTYTGLNVFAKKDGSDLVVRGSMTVSAYTGNPLYFYLPWGLNTKQAASLQRVEGYYQNVTSDVGYLGVPLINGTRNYISFSKGNTGLTEANSSTLNSPGVSHFFFRVPIQGWSSTPTLLALPTSKENVFSARIDSSSNITSKSSDWINSVTSGGTGIRIIDYSKLGLTAAPSITGNISQSGDRGNALTIQSVTATQAVVWLGVDATLYNSGFTITLTKQSPDYTAQGVFVGNVPLDYQYDLTVTGTNWTTSRAVGVVYKTGNGVYRMKGNIEGKLSSTVTSFTGTISGVIFKTITEGQAITGWVNNSSICRWAIVNSGAATFTVISSGTVFDEIRVSFDVELDSKPSFATFTI